MTFYDRSAFSYYSLLCHACYMACRQYNPDLESLIELGKVSERLTEEQDLTASDFKDDGSCECCHRHTRTTKLLRFKKGYMDSIPWEVVAAIQDK